MVFCIVAMVVFGILGIFSGTHRRYAKESFRCVTRMMTLRPCDTAFDQEMKNRISAAIMPRSEKLGRFTFRHFTAISGVFVIIMFVSLGYTAYSVYNLVTVGTCDPSNPGGCIFNPGSDPNRIVCPFENISITNATPTINGFSKVPINVTGKPLVYFFGTTWCPHCTWEKPIFVNATSEFGNWSSITTDVSGHMDLSAATYVSDYFTIKAIEIDKVQVFENTQDFEVFKHFSPEGKIPLIVMAGKYFRAGAGEGFGNEGERLAIIALLCDLSQKQDGVCAETSVRTLME